MVLAGGVADALRLLDHLASAVGGDEAATARGVTTHDFTGQWDCFGNATVVSVDGVLSGGCKANKHEPKLANDKQLASVEDMFKIHVRVGCDSCGMYPIVGKRYKCKDCKEKIGFDLCESCYNTRSKLPARFNQQHTPDHTFELDESMMLSRFYTGVLRQDFEDFSGDSAESEIPDEGTTCKELLASPCQVQIGARHVHVCQGAGVMLPSCCIIFQPSNWENESQKNN
ncbi:hypothetical protein Taro_034448 [Colocasia esculenta]|uniref:ZZ-type domain-containing protein n=1 Tax=Colocasia esculenta TaxID=4460 RepID=A0A843W7N1_COLES|nr:hypothetical protein [Colocasia esculenta]